MATFNHQDFYDRVYACWLGKSIGGTLGTPFEGKQELLDVKDFHSPSGQPLPNDDLDLQLIWLKALEERGPRGINEQVLGEYWLNYIPPHWNEYGIGKLHMRAGILPPLCGDFENPWKHSNGAWIRSEIWACCAPGLPEVATRFAWYDACVDHGSGEGTYAEQFTAAVEAAAFVEHDTDTLIDIGLSYIPADCRVARSIGIVRQGFAQGLSWQDVRNQVVADSEDLGWFQAPANVAFVILGWLYGGGDFKESLLIAVNCGDDTDCTGATLGSILGIIGGTKVLPADWVKHVGDDIITVAIDSSAFHYQVPKTCTALTERVVKMAHKVLTAFDAPMAIGEGTTDLSGLPTLTGKPRELTNALRFDFIHSEAFLSYPEGPRIGPGEETTLTLRLENKLPDPRHLDIDYLLPEGFTLMDGPRHGMLFHETGVTHSHTTFTIRLQAGETVAPRNDGVIRILSQGKATVMLIPVVLLAK